MERHNKHLIIATLQLISTLTFAGVMGTRSSFNVFIPNLKPGFEFTASALYLQPGANNLGWAAITTVLPIPTPQWRVRTFNPSYQPGFSLGAHYVFPNSGNDIQLNWSHLHTNDTDSVHVDPSSQWVSPFSQTGTPPTQQGQITGISLLKSASARLNFGYDVVNLDVGKFINFGSNWQTRFFSGVSSTWIREKIYSTFQGLPQPVLSFNNSSTYLGIGPRLGLNNTYDMYRGVHLVSQLAGSLLIGSMRPAEYEFTGSSADLALIGITSNNEKIASSSVSQLVPAMDAKIGLSYAQHLQQGYDVTFELGYMGALYLNPLSGYETNTNVIALDTGSLSTSSVKHTPINFSVGGPYVTVSMKQ